MQDIHEETLNESVKSEQSPRVVLWEIDLTVQGGERYFFCNELNEKGESVTWQGREYQAYPIEGSGFEMNGKGSSARPSLTVSNLFGLVTGMAEDLQSLVGATVVRRRVYARFLDAVNFVAGNPEADPEQELRDRWVVEQMSELTAMTASFVLATPTETDGALFPGRIMLANTCMWDYRGYARFLDAVNFVAGNPEADPEQELRDRWVVEQMSELTAMTASFVLATPTETDGALFPGRIMLANTCMWDYRG
ncbi:phage minor tail protein L, partial [Escherichia coli]|uniref:phage minor tail protein L n=16 Tax=Escherichia coli TaxID=562 RepID=UPI0010CC2355